MTVYKKISKLTGRQTWFCIFYYKDYTGKRHQKKKEGFATQKEAKAFERDFLAQYETSISAKFKEFIQVYLADKKRSLRPTSLYTKQIIIDTYIIPFFGEMPLAEITPVHVRKWMHNLPGELSCSSVKQYKDTLSAIFNYACNLYGLKSNPARMAGKADKTKRAEKKAFQIWTPAQFGAFLSALEQGEPAPTAQFYKALFLLLFYTGARIGEATALTPADIDTQANIIHISKTAKQLQGILYINPPKTPAGNRDIITPPGVIQAITQLISAQGGRIGQTDRIFTVGTQTVKSYINKYSAVLGIPAIRVHDLRHSHASLLIEKGFSPVAVRDRLGHENIQVTLNTYSHLYPNKQGEIAQALQAVLEQSE